MIKSIFSLILVLSVTTTEKNVSRNKDYFNEEVYLKSAKTKKLGVKTLK